MLRTLLVHSDELLNVRPGELFPSVLFEAFSAGLIQVDPCRIALKILGGPLLRVGSVWKLEKGGGQQRTCLPHAVSSV